MLDKNKYKFKTREGRSGNEEKRVRRKGGSGMLERATRGEEDAKNVEW